MRDNGRPAQTDDDDMTIFRTPQPAPSTRTTLGRPTMNPGSSTGIDKPIPETHNTRAPGQYGTS